MNSDLYGNALGDIATYQAARDRWCLAIEQENARRAERDQRRRLIIDSLVGNPNSLTNRPHSATSAGDVADADEGVLEANAALDIAQQEKWRAETDFHAADLHAQLNIAALKAQGVAA